MLAVFCLKLENRLQVKENYSNMILLNSVFGSAVAFPGL